LRIVQSAARLIEVPRLFLDADESSSGLHGGNPKRARPHEGIRDDLGA
jgi:hypothetical protein